MAAASSAELQAARLAELEARLAAVSAEIPGPAATSSSGSDEEADDGGRPDLQARLQAQIGAVRDGSISPDDIDLEDGSKIVEDEVVEDREEMPVVDWTAAPKMGIAEVNALYCRPTWVVQTKEPPLEFDLQPKEDLGVLFGVGGDVLRVKQSSKEHPFQAQMKGVTDNHTLKRITTDPTGTNNRFDVKPSTSKEVIMEKLKIRPNVVYFEGGTSNKEIVFDRADAKLDKDGWPLATAKNGQTPQQYAFSVFDKSRFNPNGMDMDQMGNIGGVGLRLYFYLLDFLMKAFFVMAVLTTPSVIIAYGDTMYEHNEAGRYKSALAMTTLGNIATTDADLDAGGFFGHNLWTISFIEACGSIFMLYMVLVAHRQMTALEEKVDKEAVTMADYTVMIQPQVDLGWKTNYASAKKSKRDQLILDVEKALEKAAGAGGDLAEIQDEFKVKQKCIWIAWDDDENIKLWQAKRAKLIELEAALFVAKADGDKEPANTVLEELEELNKNLDQHNESEEWCPVYVFAAYNIGEKAGHAIDGDPADPNPPNPPGEITVGGVKCNILQAPEPESLLWEHLEFSARNRMVRSYVIMAFTFTALMIGAVLISWANTLTVGTSYANFCGDVMGADAKRDADDNLINKDVCPLGGNDTLPMLYRKQYSAMVHPQVCAPVSTCSTNGLYEDIPYSLCSPSYDLAASPSRGTLASPCHTVDTKGVLMTGGDVDAMCYACICSLEDIAETTRAKLETSQGAEYCAPFEEEAADASFAGLVATIIVVVINQLLKLGIKMSAASAKSHTVEEQMISTSLRVYAVQVLNTAILMLLLRSDMGPFGDLPGEHYKTVNGKWYAEVGAPLISTMIIQFATPPATQFVMIAVDKLMIWFFAPRAKTQNQLNAVLKPRNFEIAAGYGEILLATSVTLIFGAGIPILYLVAALGFFVRYNVDKWVIVSVTARPPLYSNKLFDTFDEIFSLLLVVHVAMGLYFMASGGGETPSSTYIYLEDACFGFFCHAHTWPMMLTFVAVVVGITGKFVSKFKYFTEKAGVKAEKHKEDQIEGGYETEEVLPPFEEAYAAGLIINEDDDYVMDQFENLNDLQTSFIQTLNEAAVHNEKPFDDPVEGPKFHERCINAVDSVLGKDWIQGVSKAATKIQAVTRGKNDRKRVADMKEQKAAIAAAMAMGEGPDEEHSAIEGTDWSIHFDPEDGFFFYHNSTSVSRWETEVMKEFAWIIHYERDDGFYYNNTETGESVWTMPPEVLGTLEDHTRINPAIHRHGDGTAAAEP